MLENEITGLVSLSRLCALQHLLLLEKSGLICSEDRNSDGNGEMAAHLMEKQTMFQIRDVMSLHPDNVGSFIDDK